MANLIENLKISEHEYDSLRSEMILRIGNINNQTNSAIITILSTWTIGFALVVAFAQTHIISTFFAFISSGFFLIPIFYFVPLAIKSGENIQQIASISAYIRVFYDYRSFKNGEILFNWETSNNICSAINVYRGKASAFMMFFNDEYTILSIASFLIYFFTTCFFYKNECSLYGTNSCRLFLITIMTNILMIVSLFAIYIIHETSCMYNVMMKNTVFYVNAYIDRAVELGVFPPEEKEIMLRVLNPTKYKGTN